MARRYFRVTYDIVTPESAEHGDFAGNGFLDANENRDAFREDGVECSDAERDRIIAADHNMTLRDAIELLSCLECDGGGSFYESDGRQNYRTGEEERRALHLPDNVTPASYARIVRALKAARLIIR